MNTLTNIDIKHFYTLSKFKNIKEFNTSNEKWLADHKRDFTYSEYFAIKRLIRFAGNKVIGVANACINTILAAIKQHDAEVIKGISRSTFKRAIAKAVKIGMITRIQGVRWNGSKTANVYVFEPYSAINCHDIEPCPISKNTNTQPPENAVTERVKEEIKIINDLNHLETSNLKTNFNKFNTYSKETSSKEFDAKLFKKDWNELSLYEKIQQLLLATEGHTQNLKEYSKIIFGQLKMSLRYESNKEHQKDLEQLAYDALKTTIYTKKIKKSRFALLHGILNKKISNFLEQQIFKMMQDLENPKCYDLLSSPYLYNWLNIR